MNWLSCLGQQTDIGISVVKNAILSLFELGKKQEDIQGKTVFLLGGSKLLGLAQMRAGITQIDKV